MNPIRRSLLAFLAVLLAGCAAGTVPPDELTQQQLAPGGKLRVGVYLGSPTSMIKHASGETRGLTYEIGAELARRLGVQVEYVEFPRVAEVIEALKDAKVDFTITNGTPARAQLVDFTPPVLNVELGYLVPADSAIKRIADIDRPGVRVGVTQGSTTRGVLSRVFKSATLTEAPTVKAAIGMLAEGRLDAYATNKAILFGMSDELPGSRVLDGRWGLEHFAIGIPKGRRHAIPWLGHFVLDVNADGSIAAAAQRAGLRGTVAPKADD